MALKMENIRYALSDDCEADEKLEMRKQEKQLGVFCRAEIKNRN